MKQKIINLLSTGEPKSGPEIFGRFHYTQRRRVARELRELVSEGRVEHVSLTVQQVKISTFRIPENHRPTQALA